MCCLRFTSSSLITAVFDPTAAGGGKGWPEKVSCEPAGSDAGSESQQASSGGGGVLNPVQGGLLCVDGEDIVSNHSSPPRCSPCIRQSCSHRCRCRSISPRRNPSASSASAPPTRLDQAGSAPSPRPAPVGPPSPAAARAAARPVAPASVNGRQSNRSAAAGTERSAPAAYGP